MGASKEKKEDEDIEPRCSFRDITELVLILALIGGGFLWILHATSPCLFHFENTDPTLSSKSSVHWMKVHTSPFDLFDEQDLEFPDMFDERHKSEVYLSSRFKISNFDKQEESIVTVVRNVFRKDDMKMNELNVEYKKSSNMHVEIMKVSDGDLSGKKCDNIPDLDRFDCHPEEFANPISCVRRGCCWNPTADTKQTYTSLHAPLNIPYCYFPRNYDGYKVDKSEKMTSGQQISLTRTSKSPYPRDVMELQMDIEYETPYRLRIKISDPKKARWEVPLSKPTISKKSSPNNLYSVHVSSEGQPFQMTVQRTATNSTILNTAGAFIYSDQFLQLSYYLPTTFIYGLGEHRDTLLHSVNWTRFVMWNRDHPPLEKTNLYGSHPFYLMMENNANSHGVLLLNSNAMEAVLQPAPAITWRTIGGILDFYIFLGPSPADVISQYTELIGRTFMPPYWSLGFHQCRWGYRTANATQAIADKLTAAGMPQDVQWNDIDYMDAKRDFTTSPKFGDQKDLVEKLHSQGKHYMMIVDPGISSTKNGSYPPYDLGLSLHIYINDTKNKPLVGVVWPGKTVFPDFTNPLSQYYWTTMVKTFHDSVDFDGMWIDMNELSNFVSGSTSGCSLTDRYDHPPYIPYVDGGHLDTHTTCASGKQYLSRTYDVHNMYGLTETNASYHALLAARPGRRPFVISRSTFVGQGQYGGHWTGDNKATFHDLYKSISAILSFNMFGIPMVGADICGFRDPTYATLCQRWYQLGAFYPFSRSHNDDLMPDQDPTAFGEELLNSTRKVYMIRYSLLPYLYTLFHNSHVRGDTVARPLFVEFPEDRNTYGIDSQFLWGPALMISPTTQENATSIPAYFPQMTWFYFPSGRRMTDTGGVFYFRPKMDEINLNVRGGYIIPMQEPALTTTHSRKNNFWLLAAITRSLTASGELYWDDGDSVDSFESGKYNMIQFNVQNYTLKSSVTHAGYTAEPMTLGNVTVLGIETKPTSVFVNGKNTPYDYNDRNQVLTVTQFKANMLVPFSLSWTV